MSARANRLNAKCDALLVEAWGEYQRTQDPADLAVAQSISEVAGYCPVLWARGRPRIKVTGVALKRRAAGAGAFRVNPVAPIFRGC